jgi:signal transduction histidine kinase
MASRVRGVRAASARVALISTAIVAVFYVAIAVVVGFIVHRNLTSDIDNRLSTTLTAISSQAQHSDDSGGYHQPPGGPLFDAPVIVWTVYPDGSSKCSNPNTSAALPSQYNAVTGPQNITVGDTDFRAAGAQVGLDRVVVGQTTSSVSQALSTVVLAEVIVGPILLAIVFLGALTIGRRVGAPIELARQRQMEFTADASHELRTPLAVIEAQTTLALNQERDNAWYRRAFSRVDVESKRMRRLVEDLLWLARFDASGRRPAAEHVDLGVLARQAVDRFGAIAEARQLSLTTRVSGDSTVVEVPPEWLDRLLGVLLDNACKYSDPQGRVEVSVTGEGGRVRLAVDDSGPGIPAEERPRVFDRFHRVSDRPGGAGLGLAIGDAIVRATQGRWDIGTSAAGGASVSVSWARSLAGPRQAESLDAGEVGSPTS